MRLRHLALPVHDRERSRTFYETYFGFDGGPASDYPDGTLIIRTADGFDLALHPDPQHGPAPAFLHFGFTCAGRDEVTRAKAHLRSGGVEIVEEDDEDDLVSFKCLDPDGYRIEVYWESV